MQQRDAHARLFVYFARDVPLGVVLRRGPTDWVQLSLWRTDTDTFTPGQWVKAHVYERRCDVSPDGTLFVYFTLKGRRHRSGDRGLQRSATGRGSVPRRGAPMAPRASVKLVSC